MFSEYRDIVSKLKKENSHFASLFIKHNELDKTIDEIENGREHMSRLSLEQLKKEKLLLKDKAYDIVLKYKKENNL